jgi:hypothetical protein
MEMNDLMAQAQQLQNRVAAAQEKLANTTVRGIANGGACIVEMTGKYDLKSLKLRDDISGRPADEISQIVLSALLDAKAKADEIIDDVMGDATAGLPLPE